MILNNISLLNLSLLTFSHTVPLLLGSILDWSFFKLRCGDLESDNSQVSAHQYCATFALQPSAYNKLLNVISMIV